VASPFVLIDADGLVSSGPGGKINTHLARDLHSGGGLTAAPSSVIASGSDATIVGYLADDEGADVIAVDLLAGHTYAFAYRGTAVDGLSDPYLGLFDADFGYITEDDDGGLGRSSLITFTPDVDGTYLLYASSYDAISSGDPAIDTGNYTIDIWEADAAHDVPDTIGGAVTIEQGTTFGFLEAANDADMYRIDAVAGNVYALTYAGGISSDADWDDEPGENLGIVSLYDASGNLIADALNYETGLNFLADYTGSYYVKVEAYDPAMTGGYTLDVAELNPADYDPLDSIDWRTADNVPFVDVAGTPTAYVYFAPAGENFGELADDGVTPMTTYGWQQFQIDGVMTALQEYENILGVHYEITTDVEQATFRLLTTESEDYGAYFYPQDEAAYGDAQGIGVFNLLSGGFTLPESLEQGGYSFAVILHEFGHAHGLAHPHDNGGGSDVMLGVTGTDSLGIFDLNQGVYTVMSYNDGWATDPDGAQPFTRATIGYGWSGSLSAFDIAELQIRYGVHDENVGNTVYSLPDAEAAGTYFQTIWDSGGTDTIAYDGTRDAHIDLLAATLDYTPTGGGVVSYAEGIHGGFTIANDVVIENATGGSGNDLLLGNAAANVLTGGAGNDSLFGREGNDMLIGGDGNDTLDGGDGIDTVTFAGATAAVKVSLAITTQQRTGITADRDTITGVENLVGSDYGDSLTGNAGANQIEGGAGNDRIYGLDGNDLLLGGAGSDILEGGAGDDMLRGGLGNDTLIGGDGIDTASYADVATSVRVSLAITERQSTGGAAFDTLSGIENLEGSAAGDYLTGNAGANFINGRNGNDTITGGGGADRLMGGAGHDNFIFTSVADSAIGFGDTITDFHSSERDRIDLGAVYSGTFAFLGSGSFTGHAGELRYQTSGSNSIVSGDIDGDGLADFEISLLGVQSLQVADFVL
jgi:serralysin